MESKLVGTQDLGSPVAFANALTSSLVDETPDEEIIDESKPLAPEEEEPQEETQEEPQEEDVDEKYKDFSEAAIVVEMLKQQGRLPDNTEVGKDMNWEDFMNIIDSDANSRYTGAINDYLGSLDAERKYIEFRMQGGTRDTMDKALDLEDMLKLDIEGTTEESENNRKLVIENMYLKQGLERDTVNDLVETLQLKGKDVTEAKKALEFFKNNQSNMLEREKNQREEYEKQNETRLTAERDEMKRLISEGKIGAIELDTEEAKKDLYEALFTPNVKYVYKDNDGKEKTTRITRYQEKLNQFQSSIPQQVAFAKLLIDGFDEMRSVKEQGGREKDLSLLQVLNGRTSNRSNSNYADARGNRKVNLPNKPVFEMEI